MIGRRARTLLLAVAIDLLFGEPPSRLHPVVWTGRAIAALERHAPQRGAGAQLLYGAGMWSAVTTGAALAGLSCQVVASRIPGGMLIDAWALKSTFAVRALLQAAERVERPLARGDEAAARSELGRIVSRPVATLPTSLIAAAAIESVAENLTDSALAPWLAYAIVGAPGAAAYRALNTLDSMVGYHGRYEYLGKVSARTDDLANFAPARFGATLIAATAVVAGGSAQRAWRVMRRDHHRTESPNAGWTMASMAGALGVELEKAGAYRLGSGLPPMAGDIGRAVRIVRFSLALGLIAAVAIAETLRRGDGRGATPWRRARR